MKAPVCSLQNKCRTTDPHHQNLGRSGKLSFFIIYKFLQNCASVRQVLNLILKTVCAGLICWKCCSFNYAVKVAEELVGPSGLLFFCFFSNLVGVMPVFVTIS